jgi:tetratricopeptide (TPR) repeat protein
MVRVATRPDPSLPGGAEPRLTSAVALLLLALALHAQPAAAQQLDLKRAAPRIAWSGCGPAVSRPTVSAAQRQEADALAASATQSAILGNNAAAAELLANAARLNPGSEAIAYRLARALEELGRGQEALAGYCRFLGLAPNAADAAEARERISALAERGGVPAGAAQEFTAGIAHYDGGRLADAEAAFGRAFTAAPSWGDAVYNRGVTRLALGQRAAGTADLRRYLELNPGAPDLGAVVDVLALHGATVTAPYNPGLALASGVLLPGLGHFTTGRPAMGALVLGVAAGALATGLLIEQTDVVCLAPPVGGECPPDEVLREEVSRPYLVPALAVAAGVGILGAIDAFRGARRRNSEAAASLRIGGGSLRAPAIQLGHNGARLDLVRFRF